MRYLNLRLLMRLSLQLSLVLPRLPKPPRGLRSRYMCTTTCKACEDFLSVCQWRLDRKKRNSGGLLHWGITSPLREKNIATLHQILEDAAQKTRGSEKAATSKKSAFSMPVA